MKFLLTCLVLLDACQVCLISAAVTVDTACRMLKLTNGKVRCNGNGVFAKFECDKGYSLYGEESSIFAEGVWSTGVPRCVKSGCKLPKNIPHVKMTQLPKYNNGVVNVECDIGFIRNGRQQLYCDGVRWSDDFPSCKAYFGDQTGCDFEDKNICGWIQDNTELLDWVRNSGPTLSSGTGPLTDHTTGTSKGHYMYLENASLRHRNKLARLISVPYNSKANLALEFYYHMLGDNIGNLSVYLMPMQMNPIQLNVQHRIFYKSEAQGSTWLRANVLLQTQEKQFQLVFEATSGGTFGDIAIDDIRIIDLEELPLNDGMEQRTVNKTSLTDKKNKPQSRTTPKKPGNRKPGQNSTKKSTTIRPFKTTKTTTVKQKTSTSKTSEIYSSGTTSVEFISSQQVSLSELSLPSNPTSAESPTITTQSNLASETTSTPTATMPSLNTSIGTTIRQTPTSSTSVNTTKPSESSAATTTQSTLQTTATSSPTNKILTSESPQKATEKPTPATSANTTSTSTKFTSKSSTLLPKYTTSGLAMSKSPSIPLLSMTYTTTSYNTENPRQKTTPMLRNQKKNLKNLDSKENSLVPIIVLCAIVLGIFVPIITLIIYKRCKIRTTQITTDENIEKENNDLEDSLSDDSNEKSKTIEETTKHESNDETIQEKGNDNKDENQMKEDPVPKLEDKATIETKQVTVTTSANEEIQVQVVVQAELAIVSTEKETCLVLANAVNEDMQQSKPDASANMSVTEAALSENKTDVLPSITEENIQDTDKIKDEITIQPDDQNKL